MPAHAKLATAVAFSLALAGAGTAIAQSSNAPAGHAAYVTIVDVEETAGPEELTGRVACQLPLHERVIRQALGRTACKTSKYAYAYPSDEPAPWRSRIQAVEGDTYVDRSGSMWRVAEVTYETMAEAPEGGPELVRAMAAELLPDGGGSGDLAYAMPVDGDLANRTPDELAVDVGPAPGEAHGTPVADTSLPD